MYIKKKKTDLYSSRIDLDFNDSIYESSTQALKKMKLKNENEKIEESSIIKNRRFDIDDLHSISNKARKKLTLEESKNILSTEVFSEKKLYRKLKHDAEYLNELNESYLTNPDSRKSFEKIMTKLLVEAADLYKETGTTPRLISLAIHEDLPLEENFAIYNNNLRTELEENFRKPLLQGVLLQEHQEDLKWYLKKALEENVQEELGDIDPKEMGIMMSFMESIENHIKDVIVPRNARMKIESFIESQNPEYGKMPRNAIELYEGIEDLASKLSALLSPAIFKDKVDLGDDNFDGGKYTVIKLIVDSKPSDQDNDSDGIPDVDEDHGELPDDFNGDHSDAEANLDDNDEPLSPEEIEAADEMASDDIDPEAVEVAAEDKDLDLIENSKKK